MGIAISVIVGALFCFGFICARRLRDQRLRESERLRMREDFIRFLTHEARSPASAFQMVLPDLKSSAAEEQLPILDALGRSVQQHLVFLAKVSKVYRLWEDAGEASRARETQIEQVVNDALDGLRPQFDQKKIQIDVRRPLPPLRLFHPELLPEICTEILSNAVRFTPDGGAVRISALRDGILITDNGIGMSPAVQKKLFKPGATQTGTDGDKGSGLGLIFCAAAMERMKGSLHIETAERGGTRVTLRWKQ